MAKATAVQVDKTPEIKTLILYKLISSIDLENGQLLVGRYNTNKATLKSVAKKLNTGGK